jgi:cell division protease FtsH
MLSRLLSLFAAIALLALAAPPVAPAATPKPPAELSYTSLREAIKRHKIKSADLYPMQGVAKLTLRDGTKAVAGFPITDQELAGRLADAGAQVEIYNKQNGPSPLTLLPILLMIAVVIGFAFWIARKQQAASMDRAGGATRNGKGTQGPEIAIPDVRFSDVAGIDEVVDSLQDLLVFLTQPERFERLGAKLPRGVIFHGPPGTGKTLLAKALAGEAGVPFFPVAGSEFVEMIVGRGAARIRSLFADAGRHHAAIIFFDEFDALAKKRSNVSISGNDEREQTLNQLLVELDGFNPNSRIVCIAATNRLDTLDEAVLRPGRFGEHLLVDNPSEEGRRQILAVHSRNKPLADGVDLDRLAHITFGSSGADLADMLNRAAILAGKAGQDEITQANLEDGYLDAIAGPRKRNPLLAEGEQEVVAVHEAGHVLAAELCPTVENAMRVTIQPRGRAGGMAVYGRTDRMLHDPQYLHEKLVAILGGRAAEFVARGKITSGAANDLQQANAMARQAVEELGFSARAGQLVSTQGGQQVRVSEETVALIDAEVRRIVEDAYQDAVRLLSAHCDALDRLAGALVEHEDLDRPEIVAVLAGATGTPRATPRQASGGPVPAPARPVVHAHTQPLPRRRGERLRMRLAAALMRKPVAAPAVVTVDSAAEAGA